MRLIDAEKLIEYIRNRDYQLVSKLGCVDSGMFTSGIKRCVDAQPTIEMSSCWISVTDQLPIIDGSYIVTACDEGCSYGEGIWYDTVVVVAEYYNGCWTWNDNGTEYDLCGIVTHWMHLPQPPKGE